MRLTFGLILLCWMGFAKATPIASPRDSVGIVKVKDKVYVRHKVTKGETFSSLSRRYGCTVDDIKKSNDNLKELKIGQTIRIPAPAKNTQAITTKTDSVVITVDESHANADSREAIGGKKHIVQSGDHLNKIAAKYKVSAAQIAKWNGLTSTTVKVGQELIVSGSVTIKPYEKWNQPNSLTAKQTQPGNTLSPITNLIEETGWIEDKSVCTHPTLPIGSVVICINPDTQKQVLVTTVQRQPLNEDCVIGLNAATLEQLGMTPGSNRIIIQYNQP